MSEQIRQTYREPFYNNSGETVPAFAVMQIETWKDNFKGRDHFQIKKPDGNGKQYLLNGPHDVPAGGTGYGTQRNGSFALYEYSDGTPAVDEDWGPASGSWLLQKDTAGFFAIGDADGTKARFGFATGNNAAVYLVTPAQTIPAAALDGNDDLDLGAGFCAILKRTSGEIAEVQTDSGGGPSLIYCYNRCATSFDSGVSGLLHDGNGLALVDSNGVPLTSGATPTLLEGGPRLLAIRDRYGDYYLQPCGGRGNVIYAQVNDGSGVGSGDATFAFDNAVALVGYAPADGTGTAQNQYAQTYSNDDWVILFQRTDNDEWLTEQDGDAGTIIYAQVNDGSGVGGGDATFAFDNAIAIVGTAPAGGTGTGQNQYGQTYANDEWVLLFQEKATATWLTERKAATLTIAKALINNAAGYSSADSTVNWDGGSAITGTLSSSSGSASNVHGKAFRDNEEILLFQNEITGTFYAVKIEVDIQVATVNEGSGVATTDTTFSFDAGSALEGVGQTTGTAKNPCGLAFDDDEKFIAILADDGQWIPIKQDFDGTVIFRCKPTTDILGTSSFSGGTITQVKGTAPAGPTETINNPLSLYIGAGKWATCVIKEDGTFEALYAEDHIITWLKNQPNYSAGSQQIFTNDGGTLEWNSVPTVLNWLAGYTAGNDQSIGHDASGSTEWQDDTTC